MSKIVGMSRADMKAWNEKRKSRKCKGKVTERKRPVLMSSAVTNEWDLNTGRIMSTDSSGVSLRNRKINGKQGDKNVKRDKK